MSLKNDYYNLFRNQVYLIGYNNIALLVDKSRYNNIITL